MTKLASLFPGVSRAATLGPASVPGASADPLAQFEGRAIDLGHDVNGTTY